jgi:hypothetical protein
MGGPRTARELASALGLTRCGSEPGLKTGGSGFVPFRLFVVSASPSSEHRAPSGRTSIAVEFWPDFKRQVRHGCCKVTCMPPIVIVSSSTMAEFATAPPCKTKTLNFQAGCLIMGRRGRGRETTALPTQRDTPETRLPESLKLFMNARKP